MTRRAVSSLTKSLVPGLSARDAVAGCTSAAEATSRSVASRSWWAIMLQSLASVLLTHSTHSPAVWAHSIHFPGASAGVRLRSAGAGRGDDDRPRGARAAAVAQGQPDAGPGDA